MAIISRIVGVTLPRPPSDGDPRGIRGLQALGLQLTPALGIILRQNQQVPTRMLIRVLTDFGDFVETFDQDQTRSSPRTWFTLPDIVTP